jgi:hemolysin III
MIKNDTGARSPSGVSASMPSPLAPRSMSLTMSSRGLSSPSIESDYYQGNLEHEKKGWFGGRRKSSGHPNDNESELDCYPVGSDEECRSDDPRCELSLVRTDNDDAYCYPTANMKQPKRKDDGRLFQEYPLYVEGLEKPLCRGVGHLIFALLLPFGMYHLIHEANGNFKGTIIAILYVSSNMFCYGFSSLLHIGKWSVRQEIFIQKMDHCGIAVLSCGTMLPVSCLLLDQKIGLLFTCISVSSCAWTCYNIWQLRPSAFRQFVTAAALLPFIPFCWYRMNSIEFRSMICCCILQFFGMQVFTRGWPNPWPMVFGYHEVFHVFVIVSGMCVYLCNWSVIRRTCNPYAHRTEIIDIITNVLGLEPVGNGF